MWQLWGTVAISAVGGAVFLHYIKNFTLKEKMPFSWDWDGIVERSAITYLIATASPQLYLIPIVIAAKAMIRLILIGFTREIVKVNEPGTVSQKVRLKAELAFDLILSPAFAILIGVVF